MTLRFIRPLVSLLLAIAAGLASAAPIYYVDQGHAKADDANPGTEEAPWKTLRRAVRDPLPPGTTVIVRPGVYEAGGGSWNRPALNPPSSGAPGKPIVFIALPQHGARLDSQGDDAPIGSFARDYVVIDGFHIQSAAALGVSVFGTGNRRVRGVVIQNMKIHGMRGAGGGNTDGIRIERASGVTVRNNEIFDIRNEKLTTNAAGVKLYYSDNIIVENNEIYRVVAGVKEKEEGQEVHIRRNRFRDCGAGMELMNQNYTTTAGYYFYQNIVENCRNGFIGQTAGTARMQRVYVYNNLFYGYTDSGVSGTRHGSARRVWNNIFYNAGTARYDIAIHQDPPAEFELIDFNLYYREPRTVVGLYDTNRRFDSLRAWQYSGFDANSLLGDPKFVNAAKRDFRLAEDSPARAAGRVGGVAGNGPVNIGPYIEENDIIGIKPAPESLIERVADR